MTAAKLLAAAILLTSALSCAQDPAERMYMDALRGEETGMGRAAQIGLLDQAIALQPRRAWYRETRAIYHIDLREFERAAADIDTAVILADRPYLRFLRGLVNCQRGNHAASIPDFNAAIKDQPKNTQFYRGRSLALSALGRYHEALADAEHLVRVVPQQAESYYARGVARSGLGEDRQAVEDFDSAIRRRPELVYPLEARSRSYERLGDFVRAAQDKVRALRLEREQSGCALCLDPFRY